MKMFYKLANNKNHPKHLDLTPLEYRHRVIQFLSLPGNAKTPSKTWALRETHSTIKVSSLSTIETRTRPLSLYKPIIWMINLKTIKPMIIVIPRMHLNRWDSLFIRWWVVTTYENVTQCIRHDIVPVKKRHNELFQIPGDK